MSNVTKNGDYVPIVGHVPILGQICVKHQMKYLDISLWRDISSDIETFSKRLC